MSAVKQAAHNFEGVRSRRESLPWAKIGIYLAVAAGIFLLGLVPMWLKARWDPLESTCRHASLSIL